MSKENPLALWEHVIVDLMASGYFLVSFACWGGAWSAIWTVFAVLAGNRDPYDYFQCMILNNHDMIYMSPIFAFMALGSCAQVKWK